LVTKDVEPYAIVVGNPARVIGCREQVDGSRNFDYELEFQPWLL
jgi:acetyltransferase-like isoleucine patch superfamily enzyme